jgi:pyocin large subunit-like protein
MASAFLRRSQAQRFPTKIDAQGVIRVYDPKTNTLGAYNPSGTTRTLYKPDPAAHGYPTNLDYWNAQPGVSP